jgi:hypothetical protein
MDAVIGIDPGKSGAITIIYLNGAVDVYDMPTIKEGKKGKEKIDPHALAVIMKNLPEAYALIEEQNALTRFDPVAKRSVAQGAVSNVSLGYGYGLVIMGLAMANIPFESVPPKVWQKYFRISGNNTKEQAHSIAQRLFPSLEFQTPRGRLLDGRCDSILIAEYGRRRMHGDRSKYDAEADRGSKLSKPGRRTIRTSPKRS